MRALQCMERYSIFLPLARVFCSFFVILAHPCVHSDSESDFFYSFASCQAARCAAQPSEEALCLAQEMFESVAAGAPWLMDFFPPSGEHVFFFPLSPVLV